MNTHLISSGISGTHPRMQICVNNKIGAQLEPREAALMKISNKCSNRKYHYIIVPILYSEYIFYKAINNFTTIKLIINVHLPNYCSISMVPKLLGHVTELNNEHTEFCNNATNICLKIHINYFIIWLTTYFL